MNENDIGNIIVEEAVSIHKGLGPGLLESVYESILYNRLSNRGLTATRQTAIPIEFEGERYDEGFRADIVVEKKVILELKSIEKLNNVHKKQLLTYLKLSGLKLGYILNFGEELMKNGIIRIINGKL